MQVDEWRERAACFGLAVRDSDPWFPEGNGKFGGHNFISAASARLAKRVCRHCPVLRECGDDVMAVEAGLPQKRRFGIYAGLTPAERERADPTTRYRERIA